MTRADRLRALVSAAVDLAKRHPASGVLAHHYERLFQSPDIVPSRSDFVLRLIDVVGIVRGADKEADPVEALYGLSAASFLLGTCILFKEHAAWAILRRAVAARCKMLRRLNVEKQREGDSQAVR